MMPHLETIFSEIVIDDSYWKFPYMPDYPDHNDFEKYQTVVMQSTCLIALGDGAKFTFSPNRSLSRVVQSTGN